MVMTAKEQKQNTEKERRLLDYLPSVFRDDGRSRFAGGGSDCEAFVSWVICVA